MQKNPYNITSDYMFINNFRRIVIVFILILLLGCEPESSIEAPFTFINKTESTYTINIVYVDIYILNNFKNIVQEESITLASGANRMLSFPQYENQKKYYIFAQIIKDNEILYTKTLNGIGKADKIHIKDNPLRIEIINL